MGAAQVTVGGIQQPLVTTLVRCPSNLTACGHQPPTWAHFQGRTHSAAQLLLLLILTLGADMRLQQALKPSNFHAGRASEQCQQARLAIHEVGCHDSAAEPLQDAGLG